MTSNGYASREQLLATQGKRRYKDVTLPVSGLKVRIQSLTERELSEYQAAVIKSGRGGQISYVKQRLLDANRRLIAMCLVDPEGNRLMTPEDLPKMEGWDGADTQYLYDECSSHCGINRDDIEDLAKNSVHVTVDD